VPADAELLTLVRAIVRGDRASVSALLTSAPELATARLAIGASRQVELGADPNAVDANGTTPLHRAVRNRCAAAVDALLDLDADPQVTNGRGSTPVQLARRTTGRGGRGSAHARAQQAEILRLLQAPAGV
jgi:Ankyrin repeats (many copies)